MEEQKKVELQKERYMRDFRRKNDEFFEGKAWEAIPSVGDEIIEVLKKRELTYEEAYASLQYAHNKLEYESNFIKLPS